MKIIRFNREQNWMPAGEYDGLEDFTQVYIDRNRVLHRTFEEAAKLLGGWLVPAITREHYNIDIEELVVE